MSREDQPLLEVSSSSEEGVIAVRPAVRGEDGVYSLGGSGRRKKWPGRGRK